MADVQNNFIVKKGDNGVAVEDVQRRLHTAGFLKESYIDCCYGDKTAEAVKKFCESENIEPSENVTEKIWTKLVDASFKLGDRNLYLSMPYFHGNDVLQLQKALGTLGFQVRNYDGIFGTSTERALRRFQINMGLPSDGIAGSQTFVTLRNLKSTWSNKEPVSGDGLKENNVFWRASDVLEKNSICLFGVNEFTRDVALRMSNLARATNPFSKVLCSNAFSIAPSKTTMLLRIILPNESVNLDNNEPVVLYSEDGQHNPEDSLDLQGYDGFVKRLVGGIQVADTLVPSRLTVQLPGKMWQDAGEERSAQHFAINTLDALCSALDQLASVGL